MGIRGLIKSGAGICGLINRANNANAPELVLDDYCTPEFHSLPVNRMKRSPSMKRFGLWGILHLVRMSENVMIDRVSELRHYRVETEKRTLKRSCTV